MKPERILVKDPFNPRNNLKYFLPRPRVQYLDTSLYNDETILTDYDNLNIQSYYDLIDSSKYPNVPKMLLFDLLNLNHQQRLDINSHVSYLPSFSKLKNERACTFKEVTFRGKKNIDFIISICYPGLIREYSHYNDIEALVRRYIYHFSPYSIELNREYFILFESIERLIKKSINTDEFETEIQDLNLLDRKYSTKKSSLMFKLKDYLTKYKGMYI